MQFRISYIGTVQLGRIHHNFSLPTGSCMTRFTERMGLRQPRAMQLDDMDSDLRSALWNWICKALTTTYPQTCWDKAARGGLWDEVVHGRLDEIPSYKMQVQDAVKQWFFKVSWNDTYEMVEFVLEHANEWNRFAMRSPLEKSLNEVLEREMSGYRSVNGELVPVTSETELAAIRQATTPVSGYDGAAEHLQTALALLGQKPNPDHRNSIKESISAVESVVKTIAGDSAGGIDKALVIVERKVKLHGSLKGALRKLYGYTSDQDGIRHAMLESAQVSSAEAKFMLVACSAFVNFMLETVGRERSS